MRYIIIICYNSYFYKNITLYKYFVLELCTKLSSYNAWYGSTKCVRIFGTEPGFKKIF